MPRPDTSPHPLQRLLQQELTLGNRLLATLQEETDAIIKNDITRLGILQAEQQQCLKEQTILEKKRVTTTRDLAWALGLERVPALPALILALPARDQESLRRLRTELLAVSQQLEIVQTRNRGLIENALDYVRLSLDLLTEAALQPARYGANLTRISSPTFYIDSKA